MNREKPKPVIPTDRLFRPRQGQVKPGSSGIVASRRAQGSVQSQRFQVTWKGADIEGEIPVGTDSNRGMSKSLLSLQRDAVAESGCLRVQPECGWYTPPKAKYAVGDR